MRLKDVLTAGSSPLPHLNYKEGGVVTSWSRSLEYKQTADQAQLLSLKVIFDLLAGATLQAFYRRLTRMRL